MLEMIRAAKHCFCRLLLIYPAERQDYEPNVQPIEFQYSIFVFVLGTVRAHLKMTALGLALSAVVAIKLGFKVTTISEIYNYSGQ